MKTLRYLAAAVLTWAAALTASATPPPPPATLSVSAEQGQPFGLVLDGRALTWPVARQVRSGLLLPGWHRADVSLPAPFGPPVRFSTQVWLEPGRDNGYVLVLRRSGPQLRPVLPAGPAPGGYYPPVGAPGAGPAYPGSNGYPTPGTPGGNGYPTPGAPGAGPAYPGGNGYPAPGGSYPGGPTQAGPGQYPGGPAQPGPGAYPGGTQPGGYPDGGYNEPGADDGSYPGGAYLQPLGPADLGQLRQSLSQRPFDDDRLAIIKQALSGGSLPADELTTLVRQLSFDRSRIELAKFGYAHVSDPQNFYRVYDALQFSSSIREVQQALGLPQ